MAKRGSDDLKKLSAMQGPLVCLFLRNLSYIQSDPLCCTATPENCTPKDIA